jgi:hypothetical protein
LALQYQAILFDAAAQRSEEPARWQLDRQPAARAARLSAHHPRQIEPRACMQGSGTAAAGSRAPRRSPAELVPLIMLPVLAWLVLDVLHITPRALQPPISPKPGLPSGQKRSAQRPLPPPLPAEWQYWQKVRRSGRARDQTPILASRLDESPHLGTLGSCLRAQRHAAHAGRCPAFSRQLF